MDQTIRNCFDLEHQSAKTIPSNQPETADAVRRGFTVD
jgi:hypothetical protein